MVHAMLAAENAMKVMPCIKATHAAVFTCVLCFAGSTMFAEKTGDYFREDQNIPTGTVAISLPFAYYPSVNKMEVAIQLTDELIRKANGGNRRGPTPRQILVLVRDRKADQKVAQGKVTLDARGCGRALFGVPDFPDGEYRVEYVIGKHTVVSPRTFKRIHFPFEKTHYGEDHTVCPPFTPVQVNGASVEIVGRRYTLNGFGLFDSVRSLGRELLSSPVTLVGKTVDGKPIVWSKPTVSGKALHQDQAVFKGSVTSPQLHVESRAVIAEDGCATVTLRFLPGTDKTPIESLTLVVPLKDKETPLFHYISDNAMRFNYAGKTPRGGKITLACSVYHTSTGGWHAKHAKLMLKSTRRHIISWSVCTIQTSSIFRMQSCLRA